MGSRPIEALILPMGPEGRSLPQLRWKLWPRLRLGNGTPTSLED